MAQHPSSSGTTINEHVDVVCVGFGATALSLAISLEERSPNTKVVFLERQQKSTWNPIAKLPRHNTMPTSFLSDLVTFENPRSKYTFLKFLHSKNLLVNFTNVGKTRPSRELFSQYLCWCADHFEKHVKYDTEVAGIEAVGGDSHKIDHWRVFARDAVTGKRSLFNAKRVIIAVGQQTSIPQVLSIPTIMPSVVHSSECMNALNDTLKNTKASANIAIIGDGPQAAELFDYITALRTKDKAVLFMERAELMATANSPIEADPKRSKQLPPELRVQAANSSNTSQMAKPLPIDDDLLYRLCEHQYAQSVQASDPSSWQYQIHTSHRLSCAARLPDGGLCLAFTSTSTNTPITFPQSFDLVISATGYTNSEHKRLLSPLVKQQLLENTSGEITVDSNYRINLRRKMVRNGRAVWVVGSLGEQSEGNVLPILAERSRRLVDSLMAVQALESLEHEDQDEQNDVQARL